MNKELIYKIAKVIPKPLRNLIKKFYNPIIPQTLKVNYGERLMPEENEKFMLDKLKEVLDHKVEGDLIKFGVYKGGSIVSFAKFLKGLNINKKVYGLDTFEGLPKASNKDKIPDYYKNAMPENEINEVKEALSRKKVNDKIVLMKGLFKDTIPKLPENNKYCFAYIDCDLYEGTKEALEYLIQRMSKKGVIFIDDYTSSNWIGVKKAVLELLPERKINVYKGQAYWIKIN